MRQRAAASLLYQSQYAEPAFRNLQKSIFLKIVGRILAFYIEIQNKWEEVFKQADKSKLICLLWKHCHCRDVYTK